MPKPSQNPVDSFKKTFKSVRSHPITWLLLAVAAYSMLVGGFWVMNFFVADTPAEALAKRGVRLPPGWEAGVMNHGSYFEWYTISGHPFGFTGAVLWLAGSVALLTYLRKRLRDARAA
jgi:hypothetical protein